MLAGWAFGQEALNPPSPLLSPAPAASAGVNVIATTGAQWAHELGMPSLAAAGYRRLMEVPGADQGALTLKLVSALLEAAEPDEARRVLEALAGPRTAAWHLRAGLAAMQKKDVERARAALAAIREPELPVSDYPWYWFLQGAFVDMTAPQETDRANDFYRRAENAASNSLERAHFQLAGEEVRLRRGTAAREEELQAARHSYEGKQGTDQGYRSARIYAMMLLGREQKSDAMAFLQLVIPDIPPIETKWWDDLRLALGVIGDRGQSPAGRKALTELLQTGHDAQRQQQALLMLWEASKTEPALSQFRALLDQLIGGPAKHRIKESLLYFRAQLALLENNHDRASAVANALLTEFPGSELRVHAYGLLTRLAWEQRRYRAAADNARKARAEMTALNQPQHAAARAELAVVEAEAWFRAGQAAGDKVDFRNAADAYAATLQEPPAGIKPGELMFQRVLAEIKSESADAVKVLDELAGQPGFDAENRWQAEWSLARALKLQGRIAEALARVGQLLGSAEAVDGSVKPDLVARLAWLRASLSVEAGQAEQTLALVDGLVAAKLNVTPVLAKVIVSDALLFKARAQFDLGREQEALETLKKVRVDYADSDASIQSYLTEANFYAAKGQIVPAQKVLTTLTEDPAYQTSPYIPYAFFQLAVWSEQLGQKKDLEDAYLYIEKLAEFVNRNPAIPDLGELFFLARMKQGDVLRRQNMFPQAQRVYDDLDRRPGSVENKILARLQLARTHNAQAATDPLHADNAKRLFEELLVRVDASPDVRVEAGYNLGAMLFGSGKLDEATKVWWEDVVTPFLLNAKEPVEAGAKRPYWLARTLYELGKTYERQGKLPDAQNAYRLILEKNLGWTDLATQALANLKVRASQD